MQIKEMIPQGKKERYALIVKAAAIILLLILVIFTLKCLIPSKKYAGARYCIYTPWGGYENANSDIAYTTYVPFGRIRIVTNEGKVVEVEKENVTIYKGNKVLYGVDKTT